MAQSVDGDGQRSSPIRCAKSYGLALESGAFAESTTFPTSVIFNVAAIFQSTLSATKKTPPLRRRFFSGGESGIRTHGPTEGITGFQDQLLKPLGHLSIYSVFVTHGAQQKYFITSGGACQGVRWGVLCKQREKNKKNHKNYCFFEIVMIQ